MQQTTVVKRSLEGSDCFELVYVGWLFDTVCCFVLFMFLSVCPCLPRPALCGKLLHWGGTEFRSALDYEEGAAPSDGEKGQEIILVTLASVGKEQEGYPGWCVCVAV